MSISNFDLSKEKNGRKRSNFFSRAFSMNEFGIFLALAVLCIALGTAKPTFFSFTNVMNVLQGITLVGIMAVGEAFVIIAGGIDLSVGSIMSLSGLMIAYLVHAGVDPTISLLITLAVGFLCGFFNAFLIVKWKLNPFITTLATMNIYQGFAYLLTGGMPVQINSYLNFIGHGNIYGVPVSVIIMFFIVLAGHILLTRTVFGKKVFAVGGNERAAKLSGIRVENAKFVVYSIVGVLCALAGVISTTNLGIADPTAGSSMNLNVIAAVVIGGASLAGGKGSVIGVLIGAAIMGVLRNGFVLLRFSIYIQMISLGVVIILAVLIDIVRNKGNIFVLIRDQIRRNQN